MKIVLTGATGFIGRPLALCLLREGYEVHALVRDIERSRDLLGADVRLFESRSGENALPEAVDGAVAVINLAGEPVMGRWNEPKKRRIMNSRVELTRQCVQAIARADDKPAVLVNASAVGYYGDAGATVVDERSPQGPGFLAEVCERWESEAFRVQESGVRAVCLRIGIVLGHDGGALEKMRLPFSLGMGGRLSSGEQYMPWVHLDDVLSVIMTAVRDDRYTGAINVTAPNPVTNKEFTRSLGRALGRPTPFPVPRILLRMVLGEQAKIVLASQRVRPRRLRELDYRFMFPTIEGALDDLMPEVSRCTIRAIDEWEGQSPDHTYLARRKPTHVLETRTLIDARLEEVFPFFSMAENLGAMTPAFLAFDIKSELPIPMRKGTEIDYAIKLGPLPLTWKTVIEQWHPGRQFVDAQHKGPYQCWFHQHQFRELADGTTEMIDRVFYAVPFGPLGKLANVLFVRGQLERIFDLRTRAVGYRFGLVNERMPAPVDQREFNAEPRPVLQVASSA